MNPPKSAHGMIRIMGSGRPSCPVQVVGLRTCQTISENHEDAEGAMGGYGSGRSLGSSGRDLVEDHRALDVNALNRKGVLRPGAAGNVQWPCGASINIRAVPDGL